MCKICDSIRAVNEAADRLTEACQTALVSDAPLSKQLNVAFPPLPQTPKEMRKLLRRLR